MAVTGRTGLVGIPRVILSKGGTPVHVAKGGGPDDVVTVTEVVLLLVEVEVDITIGSGVLLVVLLVEVVLDNTTFGDGELETDDTEAGGGGLFKVLPIVGSPGVACLLAW